MEQNVQMVRAGYVVRLADGNLLTTSGPEGDDVWAHPNEVVTDMQVALYADAGAVAEPMYVGVPVTAPASPGAPATEAPEAPRG